MNEVEIIDYEDSYHEKYKELAYEWLHRYNLWEPLDDVILNDPHGIILDKGGYIFLAQAAGTVIGTVSLIPYDNECMEIAKLAVTEKAQGCHAGSMLMEQCVETARKRGIKKLILFTNHNLSAAQSLYRKFGFQLVDEVNIKYSEADLKMELLLPE